MKKINLNKISTRAPKRFDKQKTSAKIPDIIHEISALQVKMFAQKKYSILIVLQGLDASGKDGLIRQIFHSVSPFGIGVKSFEKPTPIEYSYDFLWRVHKEVPAKGMIKIFNRSHYEDILVPTVEGYIDLKKIERRYEHINSFESLLEENDTIVLKFYLHLSKEKQHQRLLERLNLLRKHYKHNDSDWHTRLKFEEYVEVYENILERCSKIPWHIIPADQKWYKVYLVAKKLLDTLRHIDLEWPELDSKLFTRDKKHADLAREMVTKSDKKIDGE